MQAAGLLIENPLLDWGGGATIAASTDMDVVQVRLSGRPSSPAASTIMDDVGCLLRNGGQVA